MLRVAIPLLCWFLVALSQAHAQKDDIGTLAKAESANRLTYEVISIRYAKGQPLSAGISGSTDSFWMRNLPLGPLVSVAYGVQNNEDIVGWPKWATSVRFDIDAKMDAATVDALKRLSGKQQEMQRQWMLQFLLEDRFQLKVHRAMQVRKAYELVVAKRGLKMQENHPATETGTPAVDWTISDGRIDGHAMPLSTLAFHLQGGVGSLVVDKTGLSSRYDVALHWDPSNQQDSDSTGPSIFTAVQEQLGLQLKPVRTEVETIVIDHLEMPSPN